MNTETEDMKQWAIVSLFGHHRIAGQVSPYSFGGVEFIRVDVPPTESQPGFTRLFGGKAIYDIAFVTEEIARAAAKTFRSEPVTAYEIPELRQLRLGHTEDSLDD